jgi:hypothetical protein
MRNSMGHLREFERIELKEWITKKQLGPTTRR